MKQLGEKGLQMIRSPRKHPELRCCWDVIGKTKISGAKLFNVLFFTLARLCVILSVKHVTWMKKSFLRPHRFTLNFNAIHISSLFPDLKQLIICWCTFFPGKSLPHRPHHAIYRRARILLNRSDERKWTQEEKEYIRRYNKFFLLK